MEPFNIGLDREEIEALLHLTTSDHLAFQEKIHHLATKINYEKERDCLIRKIQCLSMDELVSFCLDNT